MRCMIISCTTDLNFWNEMSGISSHRFPKDDHRKQRWIQALNQAGSNYNMRKDSRICSLHFKTSDYFENLRGKLKREAVPSLLLAEKGNSYHVTDKNISAVESRVPFNNITNTISTHRPILPISVTVGSPMTPKNDNSQLSRASRELSNITDSQKQRSKRLHAFPGEPVIAKRIRHADHIETNLLNSKPYQPQNFRNAQEQHAKQIIVPSNIQSEHRPYFPPLMTVGNTMTMNRKSKNNPVAEFFKQTTSAATETSPTNFLQQIQSTQGNHDMHISNRPCMKLNHHPDSLSTITPGNMVNAIRASIDISPFPSRPSEKRKVNIHQHHEKSSQQSADVPFQTKRARHAENYLENLPTMLEADPYLSNARGHPRKHDVQSDFQSRFHEFLVETTSPMKRSNLQSKPIRMINQIPSEISQQLRQSSAFVNATDADAQPVSVPKSSSQPPEPTVTVNSTQREWVRFAGDIRDVSTISPDNAKVVLPRVLEQLHKSQVRVNRLKNQVFRLRKNEAKFKKVMAELQANNLISSEGKLLLQTYNSNSKLLSELSNVHHGLPYSDTLRSFATTLNFYSPKAYRFVRAAFNNVLPHEKKVSKWYRAVDGEPGITDESLNILEIKAKEMTTEGRELLVSLSMDEVAIRQQVEWNPYKKKFDGVTDYGESLAFLIEGDDLIVAKEALVFMVSSIEGDWKIPVAYFLINGLKTNPKQKIVESVLIALQNVGAKVVGFTFDGTSTNISVANSLGCSLKVGSTSSLVTHFRHPTGGHPVYVLLDACHMLKLIRNVFSSQPGLGTMHGEARWEYISKLNEFQNLTGMKLAPKLSDNHIKFQNQKMKVALAAQTFSRSVADALNVLQNHDPAFVSSDATIEFVNLINNVFDTMNSRDDRASGFKKPLCKENFDEINQTFKYAELFLKTLKLPSGQPVLQSASKTGFLGFLINIQSFRDMYVELVLENNVLICIRTYRFSQDHVETFFAAVRAKGGANNNPSATQFKAAYKRLLTNNDVTASSKANCRDFGDTTLLSVSLDNNHHSQAGTTEIEDEELKEKEIDNSQRNERFDHMMMEIEEDFADEAVKNAAIQQNLVHIRKELVRVTKCSLCAEFAKSDSVGTLHKVCQVTETHFNALVKDKNNMNVGKYYNSLVCSIVEQTLASYEGKLEEMHPSTESSAHLNSFIKKAVEININLLLKRYCKNIRPFKESTRSKYTKLILFEGH